ncbi:MAG: hypothetical protein KDE51_14795, partial [Anaerolineales bacterium]|nr:hypothetical protein [Anaerolineales bacterium]
KRPNVEFGTTVVPGLLIVSAGSSLIFGVWSAVLASSPPEGYLAANVEPIASLQETLLGIEEDIAEIQETTAEIAETTANTAEDVQAVATVQGEVQETVEDTAVQVDAIATAQAQGFADIQTAFANLQSNQVLVDDPQTPQEWYSNARLYQLQGNTAQAIASYEGYFAFNLEYVDPYIEYTNLLKSTEGIARTRQIISEMLNQNPDNRTLDLIVATLLDFPEDRVARLEALAGRAPDYGPVFYELGQEYYSQLLQSFTQNLVTLQADAFGRALELEEEQQGYSRYFIDKSLAQTKLQEGEQLVNAYSASSAIELDFLAFYSSEGLQIALVLPEANIQKVLFSVDDPTPSIETGQIQSGSFTSVSNQIGPLPLERGEHTLYVQYIDANGTPSEIVTYDYRIDDIVVNYTQQPFDFSSNATPAVFTLAVVDADPGALYTYNYGLDPDALTESMQGVGSAGVIQLSLEKKGITPCIFKLQEKATPPK